MRQPSEPARFGHWPRRTPGIDLRLYAKDIGDPNELKEPSRDNNHDESAGSERPCIPAFCSHSLKVDVSTRRRRGLIERILKATQQGFSDSDKLEDTMRGAAVVNRRKRQELL